MEPGDERWEMQTVEALKKSKGKESGTGEGTEKNGIETEMSN
jgi:hypothetical protein